MPSFVRKALSIFSIMNTSVMKGLKRECPLDFCATLVFILILIIIKAQMGKGRL